MTRPSAPLPVLIVEDEALLAMDLEAMVEDSGHNVVAEAASVPDVARLADSLCPAIAFVDIQLAKGTSGLDAARLIGARWPRTIIVFVTANPVNIPPDFCGAHGVIAKPISRNGLISAMHYIAESLTDPPPTSTPPASFVASQAFAATWAADSAR